jgi:hypothetical protein
MAEPDLTFLARQSERILTEMANLRVEMSGLRDDMRVLTAMTLRVDHTQTAHLDETRALHQQIAGVGDQIARMNDRVRRPEDTER